MCLLSHHADDVLGLVQVYMLEIYQDSLIDLLLPKNGGKQRKLEIKKDSKVELTLLKDSRHVSLRRSLLYPCWMALEILLFSTEEQSYISALVVH